MPAPEPATVAGDRVVRRRGPGALDLVPGRLPDAPQAFDAARLALARSVHRLVRHDHGVRVGRDPEEVHQARVATRRLRSDLRAFRGVVDRGPTDVLRDELRWLADGQGAVRDLDVMLERLAVKATRLDDKYVASVVLTRFRSPRHEARLTLIRAMSSFRYLLLVDRLLATAWAPPRGSRADEPAAKAARRLVRRTWRRVQGAVAALDDAPSDAGLHVVRRRAKQCRYAAEAVMPTVGKHARRLAAAMEDVQDVLGEHQDAVVAQQRLVALRVGATTREAMVIDRLAAMERDAAEAARAAWPKAWKAARSKKLRSWL